MKKILFFAASVILFGSCTKSPEQKVNALVKEYLEKTLYHPDTYAPTNTELDSAFTPYDDPVFYEKTLKLAKLGVLIEECNDDASSAKRGMAIWSGPYQSSFDRVNYKEDKAKYDEAIQKKKKALAECEELGKELKKLKNQKEEFIGFKAVHSYRANNNAGQTIGGSVLFIISKNLNSILATYDMDSEEYKAVDYLYKEMQGKASVADEVSLDR